MGAVLAVAGLLVAFGVSLLILDKLGMIKHEDE